MSRGNGSIGVRASVDPFFVGMKLTLYENTMFMII